VLARTPLPERYVEWNERWSAPGGRIRRPERVLPDGVVERLGQRWPKLRGPFGFQPNNPTRLFEFPWAHEQIGARPGLRLLEIGGSNSGLQFVLSSQGAEVTNVDPGEDARGKGWRVTADSVAHLNQAFGTDVRFVGTTLQQAELPSEHFDVAYSVSTIEHIPHDEHESLMSELHRVLKPGGRLVMTIDLFFNLAPFTTRTSNEWGTNADVAKLVAASGMELEEGDRAELLGFPEFSVDGALGHMESFTFGGYPAGAQCLVLRR
jgi:2-polyprenyl-3-methyl-5-hydroxy-6-metoxy-1,4-benzoquinol methylase